MTGKSFLNDWVESHMKGRQQHQDELPMHNADNTV
jgi:hypothetical protein